MKRESAGVRALSLSKSLGGAIFNLVTDYETEMRHVRERRRYDAESERL